MRLTTSSVRIVVKQQRRKCDIGVMARFSITNYSEYIIIR